MDINITIKNLIIIVAILLLAFLSQSVALKSREKALYSQIQQQGGSYASKMSTWFYASVYPKASGEVSKLQSITTQKIIEQKNNLAQNTWEIIKNYFAKKFSNTFGTEVK